MKKRFVPCAVPGHAQRPTVRQMLDLLDDYLEPKDRKAKDLWAVLSALRGPDNQSLVFLKKQTTEVIRSRAFPKTALNRYRSVGASFAKSGAEFANTQVLSHFGRHIDKAAQVLRIRRPVA